MQTRRPYRWLFRKMPVMASAFDVEGNILDVSDAWTERLGHAREDVIGRRPEQFCTADTARRIMEEYMPLVRQTGRLDDVSAELVTVNGEIVQFLVSTIIEHDAEGRYLGSVNVYRDYQELARLNQRLEELYRASPTMLFTLDGEGRLIAVSDRFLEKMGYRREELLGRDMLEFLSQETIRALEGGRLPHMEHSRSLYNQPRQIVTRSGEVIDVLVSTATELDDQGRLRRILAAVKDVTEQKQAQREMAAAYEEIARLKDELQAERDYLREQEEVSMNFGRIVGSSPALRQMLARIEAVAGTNATVLVTGESGVGKELVARAIHGHSTRSGGPLVKVNCPSVPRELFESEFFGHVKGAFTGAHRDRIGRFQLADGGTLFLDEVGEIPIELQGKLLRVLQEQEFERVGEDSTRSVDVRVIAATNRDLAKEVSAGRFREDLFYRLAVFPVNVPPLRERREDIPQLARHFLEQAARDLGREVPALTTRQLDELTGYGWPGNVRELKNVLERAVILASGGRLRLDLGGRRGATVAVRVQDLAGADAGSPGYLTEAQLRRLEQENLRRVLELTGGRVAGPRGAAKLLGLKPSTLRDRVKSLGLAASPRA